METPARRRLVPLWAIYAPLAVLVVAGIVALVVSLTGKSALVSVPNVAALDVAVARSRLGQRGLTLAKGDRRFSPTIPLDAVIDQSPAPGALVPRGSAVTVVLSAGSEAFPMPDIVGMPLATARQSLQDKGLVVQTEVIPSDRPKNVVVASTPAAGVTVSTADVVKLSVSSGTGGIGGLQPADLTGRSFVLDPSPMSGVGTDTVMEVERRLDSLLEASGAKVTVTRSITETGAAAADAFRAQRVKEASATAVIGLAVHDSGPGGVSLTIMQSLKVPSSAYLGSVQLSQALVSSIVAVSPGVRTTEVPVDAVLQADPVPGVRVWLGSLARSEDTSAFASPTWDDSMARAIYGGIAKTFGPK